MIGVITRQDKSPTNKDIYLVYKKINDVINDFGEIGIGILPNNIDKIKEVLNICDGVILEGGDDFTDLDIEIIKYIYEKDIPCLGICLGMQEMAYTFNGEIKDFNSLKHYSNDTYLHDVQTSNNSIYSNRTIKVNSRHKSYISKTDLEVTALSMDNIIEMVEDKSKTFFIGVQWHPEDLYDIDLDANLLFSIFFKIVKEKRLKNKDSML